MRWRALPVVAIALLAAARLAHAADRPRDTAEVGAFLDGLVAGLMTERHVPGAVVLVVKDGAMLVARGYGVADLSTGRPVDPETTLFRVASVSKLFTATAAMQLVEQGKLALDADVNRWLDGFTLAERFGKPVTLANLLTHTAGFDDRLLGMTAPLTAPPVALGTYLAGHMPPRVLPPGDVLSYSNHGLALVGYLVQRASGEPFAEYVRRHILEPLGMMHSGFGLPDPLPPGLAVPYLYKSGAYIPMGYDRLRVGPAGDLYTSAADMSRFMIAHLEGGRLGGTRILGEATARAMHRRQFSHHPRLDGWCYGFEETSRNGVRTIGHGGDWRGFGTILVLVPDARLGLFVSTTRSYDIRFMKPLVDRFFDRYFPRAAPIGPPAPPADFAARAARFTGTYLPVRHVRGDFLKLGLFEGESRVTADGTGALVLHHPRDVLDPVRLVEVGPLLFQSSDNGRFVAFRTDRRGRVSHMFLGPYAMTRAAFWEWPRLHGVVALVCLVVFAATAAGWAVGAVTRRLAGGPPGAVPW
ncbi:MAG: serine hydrolase domain-containing protein, partial [Candidatus Rokuibacteriota bacterium]